MLLGWRFEWRPALSALSSSLACESFWDCPISSRREPQDRHKKGISMHNDRIQSEHLFLSMVRQYIIRAGARNLGWLLGTMVRSIHERLFLPFAIPNLVGDSHVDIVIDHCSN